MVISPVAQYYREHCQLPPAHLGPHEHWQDRKLTAIWWDKYHAHLAPLASATSAYCEKGLSIGTWEKVTGVTLTQDLRSMKPYDEGPYSTWTTALVCSVHVPPSRDQSCTKTRGHQGPHEQWRGSRCLAAWHKDQIEKASNREGITGLQLQRIRDLEEEDQPPEGKTTEVKKEDIEEDLSDLKLYSLTSTMPSGYNPCHNESPRQSYCTRPTGHTGTHETWSGSICHEAWYRNEDECRIRPKEGRSVLTRPALLEIRRFAEESAGTREEEVAEEAKPDAKKTPGLCKCNDPRPGCHLTCDQEKGHAGVHSTTGSHGLVTASWEAGKDEMPTGKSKEVDRIAALRSKPAFQYTTWPDLVDPEIDEDNWLPLSVEEIQESRIPALEGPHPWIQRVLVPKIQENAHAAWTNQKFRKVLELVALTAVGMSLAALIW